MGFGFIIKTSKNNKFIMQKICLTGSNLIIGMIKKNVVNISKDFSKLLKVYPIVLMMNHFLIQILKIKSIIYLLFTRMFKKTQDILRGLLESLKLCFWFSKIKDKEVLKFLILYLTWNIPQNRCNNII